MVPPLASKIKQGGSLLGRRAHGNLVVECTKFITK